MLNAVLPPPTETRQEGARREMLLVLLVVPIRAWNGPLVSRAHLTPRFRNLPSQRSACTSCAVEEEDDAIDTLFAWMDDNGDIAQN